MATRIDRRRFLGGSATSLVIVSANRAGAMDDAQGKDDGFALALGGGAARGLAHIPVLEVLDDLGVAPRMIAGTSMGSIIGACYASGMTGLEIRAYCLDILTSKRQMIRTLFTDGASGWKSVFSFSRAAVVEPERLVGAVLPQSVPETLSELRIPLQVVTTDYYREEAFVISSGPLRKAIGASSSLPVLLAPVAWEGRVLIDGGFVNPTPFDVFDEPVPVVGVDVTGAGNREGDKLPGAIENWIGSAQIALHSLVNERLKHAAPDVLIRPEIGMFQTMDFHRAKEILAAADLVKEPAKRAIAEMLERQASR